MRADEHVVANRHGPEDPRECANLNAMSHSRMAFAGWVPGDSSRTQRDTAQYITVVAQFGRFAEHSSDAVIEYKTPADAASRVQFGARK